MRPAASSSPRQPTKPRQREANRAAGMGWSKPERDGFVTPVTRLRALLKACPGALKDGETERANRILAEAQRLLVKPNAEKLRRD